MIIKKHAKKVFSFWPTLVFFIIVVISIVLYCTFKTYPQKIDGIGLILMRGELKQIISPTSGMVESWLKEEGDIIKAGDVVAIIRDQDALEKTTKVIANIHGVMAEIIAYANTMVMKGTALAIVSNEGDAHKDLELVGFVSSLVGKKIKPGLKALINPSISNPYVDGYLIAQVKRVGKLPMTKTAIQSIIKIPEMAKYIRGKIEGEPFVVVLSPELNAHQISGYLWSGPGPSFELDSGIIADFSIIVAKPTILSLLWPSVFYRHRGDE